MEKGGIPLTPCFPLFDVIWEPLFTFVSVLYMMLISYLYCSFCSSICLTRLCWIYWQEKSNGSSQGGPRQRAEALAALNNAFNSSPETAPSTVCHLVYGWFPICFFRVSEHQTYNRFALQEGTSVNALRSTKYILYTSIVHLNEY